VMEVIHAVFTASKETGPGLLSKEAVHRNFAVSVAVSGAVYSLSREGDGRFVIATPKAEHYVFDVAEALSLLGDAVRNELRLRYVAWINGCRALFYGPRAGETRTRVRRLRREAGRPSETFGRRALTVHGSFERNPAGS